MLNFFKKLILIGKIFISGIFALILLSLIIKYFDHGGVWILCEDGSTEVKTQPDTVTVQRLEGCGINRTDFNGYFNPDNTPFEERPVDILLLGSSHLEGLQVMQNENASSLLNESLPDLRTYNIAVSGHDFLNCINNLKDAVNTYEPTSFVVIETSKLVFDENALAEAFTKENTLFEGNNMDLDTRIFLNDWCPSVMSLFYATRANVKASLSESDTAKMIPPVTEEYQRILTDLITYAANCMPENCRLIILYHPVVKFDRDGTILENEIEDQYIRLFSDICSRQNVIFVDMTETFDDMFYNDHLLAHGFTNTQVEVGHLNRYGHRAIAEALTSVIEQERN